MSGPFGWLERIDADALRTDQYLDALLASGELRPRDLAAPDAAGGLDAGPAVDAAIRAVADDLAATALRVHPSFRFEERLARRLAEAAAGMHVATAAGSEGASPVIIFPCRGRNADVDLVAALPGRGGAVRPLLVGGALTSAAISIAGAAFVAWRRGRTSPYAAPAAPGTRTRLRLDARRRLD